MKRRLLLPCSLAVFALAVGGLFAGGDEVTLEGSFVWLRDGEERTGELMAVFSPAEGDDQWTVAFYFDWEDEPRVFEGSARGKLSEGELEGAVDSDDENHKLAFRFGGSFEDGVFTGTHGYLTRDGNLKESGTLQLQRAG